MRRVALPPTTTLQLESMGDQTGWVGRSVGSGHSLWGSFGVKRLRYSAVCFYSAKLQGFISELSLAIQRLDMIYCDHFSCFPSQLHSCACIILYFFVQLLEPTTRRKARASFHSVNSSLCRIIHSYLFVANQPCSRHGTQAFAVQRSIMKG